MKKTIVVLVLIVAGCASREPSIEVRTVDRIVPVVEKCIATKDIPARPFDLGKRPTNDARALSDILYAKVQEWIGYGDKANAMMKRCAG